jgi:hypothetical protein
MLSRQDNEIVTRVGPGTPMGELMGGKQLIPKFFGFAHCFFSLLYCTNL